MSSNYRKVSPVNRAALERAVLGLVQGPGVVPTPGPLDRRADPTVVETVAGDGSLADVLAERGRLSEPECRGVGARIAAALAEIHEHGVHCFLCEQGREMNGDRGFAGSAFLADYSYYMHAGIILLIYAYYMYRCQNVVHTFLRELVLSCC